MSSARNAWSLTCASRGSSAPSRPPRPRRSGPRAGAARPVSARWSTAGTARSAPRRGRGRWPRVRSRRSGAHGMVAGLDAATRHRTRAATSAASTTYPTTTASGQPRQRVTYGVAERAGRRGRRGTATSAAGDGRQTGQRGDQHGRQRVGHEPGRLGRGCLRRTTAHGPACRGARPGSRPSTGRPERCPRRTSRAPPPRHRRRGHRGRACCGRRSGRAAPMWMPPMCTDVAIDPEAAEVHLGLDRGVAVDPQEAGHRRQGVQVDTLADARAEEPGVGGEERCSGEGGRGQLVLDPLRQPDPEVDLASAGVAARPRPAAGPAGPAARPGPSGRGEKEERRSRYDHPPGERRDPVQAREQSREVAAEHQPRQPAQGSESSQGEERGELARLGLPGDGEDLWSVRTTEPPSSSRVADSAAMVGLA